MIATNAPRLLTIVLGPMVLSACALGQVGAVIHPTVSGSLVVRDANGVETRWTPDRCTSGDLGYFLGFDFSTTGDQTRLRVMRQPTGEVLVRWTASAHATTLRAADCSELDLQIQPTGWRVNEVREFAGKIQLQCQAPDGARIEGSIAVDHCH